MDDSGSAGSFTVPPLTPAALVETLALAAQPSPEALHRADSTLTAWERTDPRFCPLLLDVAFGQTPPAGDAAAADAQHEQQQTVRVGAIIRLKNVCDKFWRPRVVSRIQLALSDDVKAHVRAALLQRTLTEPDRAVAVQATLCIAKIARTDFPAQWPDLFDFCQRRMEEAYGALRQGHGQGGAQQEAQYRLVLLRAAEICARALKTLASAKLLASKIRMTELSRQLLPTLHPIFTELFRSNLPTDASGAPSLDLQTLGSWATTTPLLTERIRTSHLLLKCLTHLAVADMGMITARTFTSRLTSTSSSTEAGPSSESQNADNTNLAQAFFRSMPVFLQQIFDLRAALVAALLASASSDGGEARKTLRPLLASLTKHLIAFSKLFLALVERDKSKAARWDGWAEVVLWYWARAAEYDPHAGRPLRWDPSRGPGLEGVVLELDGQEEGEPGADGGTNANADPGAPVVLPARLVIHALVLLRLTLTELKRPGTAPNPTSAPLVSEPFLATVLETVLGRHMLLTRAALHAWVFDAESWVLVEGKGADAISTPSDGSAGDEVEVRHAAERLLVGIVQTNKQAAERVWALFEASGANSLSDAGAFEIGQVVQREALYNALGYVTPYLPGADVRITTALRRLLPEAGASDSAPATWLLVRRRILLLLDAWIEGIAEADLGGCFPVVLSLLGHRPGVTDTVLRLTAAGTLWQLVDTPNFKPEMLAPHITSALRLLCVLVGAGGAEDGDDIELEDLSSVRSCTRALALIAERMGASVAPHVPTLVSLLPALWERDDEQCRIRPGVLVLTGRLLSAIALVVPTVEEGRAGGGTSRQQIEELHAITALMVEQSLQPPLAPMIGIDALQLWSRALASTPYMTDPLFGLLRLAPGMLTTPDYTQHVCGVITSSALLAPREVVAQHGDAVWGATAGMVADDMCGEITYVLKMVDEVVAALGADLLARGVGTDGNVWAEVAVRSGLAHALLGATVHFQETSIIGAAFISTIARISVSSQPGVFLHIMRDSAAKLAGTLSASSAEEAYVLATRKLVQLICERFENMASRHRRRLIALALAKILEDADPGATNGQDGFLFELIPEMVTPWTEVLEDEKERRELAGAAGADGLGRPASPLDTIGEDIDDAEWLDDATGPSPETARWTHLRDVDPAKSGVFAPQLSRALNAAQAKAPDAFNAAMGRVDPLVLDMLMRGLQALSSPASA